MDLEEVSDAAEALVRIDRSGQGFRPFSRESGHTASRRQSGELRVISMSFPNTTALSAAEEPQIF
jgi:hypothetical protein